MAKRVIASLFHTYRVGDGYAVAEKGETVDLSAAETERGDALGVFVVDEEKPARGRKPKAEESSEESGE